MAEAYLTKKIMISAMHDLRSDKLSVEENKKIFGKCYNLHGHDYYISVTIKGKIDPKSGLICNRDRFEDILEKSIVKKYHKTFLNDFFGLTTGEKMVKNFYKILEKALKPMELVRVTLQETPKNHFTYGKAIPKSPSGEFF